MPNEINFRDLHSGEVQEIIGRAPRWVIRRGTLVITSIIVLLFAGAWFIRYPDVVSVPMVIASSAPPVKVVAGIDGVFKRGNITNGMYVTKGQPIGTIENPLKGADMHNLITAPISGTIAFYPAPYIDHNVTSGQPVCMVVPQTMQYETWAYIPVSKAGPVKKGQHVLIKLQEYPYAEFGLLQARVESNPDIAIDSVYAIKLLLKNNLHTTRNYEIKMRAKITGTADIITRNKNVLQRLFEGVIGFGH